MTCMWGTCDFLINCQGHFGVIRLTCLEITYNSKTDLVFKVISGSFGALVSKWPVSGKRLAVERNGVKFGSRGLS